MPEFIPAHKCRRCRQSPAAILQAGNMAGGPTA